MKPNRLAILLLASHVGWVAPALAMPVGSFTFNFDGTAEEGTKFRVTMVSEEVLGSGQMFALDFEMDISGSNKNQATQRLQDQFRARGVEFLPVGSNSTDVTGLTDRNPNDPNQTVTARIKKVDGGSPLVLDGTDVQIQRGVKPGDKWKASFEPGPATATGGLLAFELPGLALSTFLNPGTTPLAASIALFNLLSGSGFPDVDLQGTEVSFLLSPADELITRVAVFSFAGSDLHFGLEIPAALGIPEPATLALLAAGLLSLIALCGPRLDTPPTK